MFVVEKSPWVRTWGKSVAKSCGTVACNSDNFAAETGKSDKSRRVDKRSIISDSCCERLFASRLCG